MWERGHRNPARMVELLRQHMLNHGRLNLNDLKRAKFEYVYRPPETDTEGNPLDEFTAIKVTWEEEDETQESSS